SFWLTAFPTLPSPPVGRGLLAHRIPHPTLPTCGEGAFGSPHSPPYPPHLWGGVFLLTAFPTLPSPPVGRGLSAYRIPHPTLPTCGEGSFCLPHSPPYPPHLWGGVFLLAAFPTLPSLPVGRGLSAYRIPHPTLPTCGEGSFCLPHSPPYPPYL